MARNLFIIFIITVCIFMQKAFALDIVYPSSKDVTINAVSTFFIGNTHPGSVLKINNESVKLWDGGGFVHLVPLFYGVNNIKIESVYKGKKTSVTYNIKRNKPSAQKQADIPLIANKEGTFLYAKTIKENATVREKPSTSSKRIIDLPSGIVLYLAGKQGEYYKIDEKGKTEFWIHQSNIEEPVCVTKKIPAKIKKPEYYSDRIYNYTKIAITRPVLYTIEQEEKKLKLTLFGAVDPASDSTNSDNIEFIFEDENQIAGYDGIYEDNKFILRRARIADKINPNKPLYGVRIFIDAGHGGNEKGAVGPTRVCEKDINLAISKKLIKKLKEEGAIVSYSRLEDKKVNLYDRVKMAKDNNVFISLSIHNNSLPNGKNPYTDHGTETHYYNDNAKVLAFIIKNNLANDLKIKDNGLHKSSFALNRSTNPISVLVEVAYMINPDEYKKLRTNEFQTAAAKSITKSLKEFMLLLKK